MSTPRPPDPESMEVHDLAVVVIGTVLWAAGLVAALVLHDRLADDGRGDWVWVMAAGVFLGLVGIRTVRRRRSRRTTG